ncbi:MAG: hypothetical protein K8T89_09200 [Planctomycetes bacterium]|nr:hypothetical protein [Planctomycetota bacterium]
MKYAKVLGLGVMFATFTLTACDKKTDPSGDKKNEHKAHGKGPNNGVVFDLGAVHAEFSVVHPDKQCTLLILEEDEKTLLPIDAEKFTVTTKETKTKDGKVVPPLTIEMWPKDKKDGKTSKFVGDHPELVNVADFEGIVIGEINKKGAKGTFKEE